MTNISITLLPLTISVQSKLVKVHIADSRPLVAANGFSALNPHLIHGSLGGLNMSQPSKLHVDLLSRVCGVHPCDQHTDGQIMLRVTSVAIALCLIITIQNAKILKIYCPVYSIINSVHMNMQNKQIHSGHWKFFKVYVTLSHQDWF